MGSCNRIVIKVGSSTLSGAHGGIDREYVRELVQQIAEATAKGTQVVLVSSGAISAGMAALGFEERPTDIPSLQAAASVGQVALAETYQTLFAEHGITIGQVLLTRHDTGHRESFLHARDTFERLLTLGAVPVVNENDTVAVDEIRFGDNDSLAALVATMINADLVVLLSDIDGLYTADPRISAEAELLEHVEELTDDLMAAAGGSGSHMGSGGMATKLDAANILMKAGIPLVICDGKKPDAIADAIAGRSVGTKFAGGEATLSARKLWIALGRNTCGEIVIDDGARDAVVQRQTSLLPAGVVAVSGTFAPGDAVVLKDRSGVAVARGLTELSSADIERVKGLKTSQISEVLPDVAGKEVVHRDHLVVL